MAKIECICKECGINFFVDECYIKRDGKRIYCSMACRIKNISGSKNPRYKADQGWLKCVYCGKTPEYFALAKDKVNRWHIDLYSKYNNDHYMYTIDHIYPKSKGGKNSIENY